MSNISQSKGNQAMKFVIFFLRNHAENMARRLVPDLHISYRIFQEKSFSCYILLTEQISLSDCFSFLRYNFVSNHTLKWFLKIGSFLKENHFYMVCIYDLLLLFCKGKLILRVNIYSSVFRFLDVLWKSRSIICLIFGFSAK